jgi:hypothetical protein
LTATSAARHSAPDLSFSVLNSAINQLTTRVKMILSSMVWWNQFLLTATWAARHSTPDLYFSVLNSAIDQLTTTGSVNDARLQVIEINQSVNHYVKNDPLSHGLMEPVPVDRNLSSNRSINHQCEWCQAPSNGNELVVSISKTWLVH